MSKERPYTLAEWRANIAQHAPTVGRASHAHNIVTTCLQAIAKDWGTAEANRAVRDFKLERKGWQQHCTCGESANVRTPEIDRGPLHDDDCPRRKPSVRINAKKPNSQEAK